MSVSGAKRKQTTNGGDIPVKKAHPDSLHARINELYNGRSRRAGRFRWGLLAFDILSICYFVTASFFHHTDQFHSLEMAIGVIYLLEFAARMYISRERFRETFGLLGLTDLIVIVSLLAPALVENFVALRVLRALRLLRSYRVLKMLRQESRFVRLHEDIILGSLQKTENKAR